MLFPILVPLGSRHLQENDPHAVHIIRQTYIEKLSRYKLLPLLAPATLPRTAIKALYKQARGVLFVGGGDFDASWYGQSNHPKTSDIDPFRDRLEMYLLKKVLRDKKPFLGICRGCQALAIGSGGTLTQHLDVADEVHQVATYGDALKNRNTAVVFAKTRTYQILKNSISVGCAHHQAVDQLGANMRVAAQSPGGVTEIIESTDPDHFCIGIQSHPELEDNGPLELIFKAFAKAVRSYK